VKCRWLLHVIPHLVFIQCTLERDLMHRKLEGRIAVVRPYNNGGVANTDAPSMLRGHGYVIMQVVTVPRETESFES